MFGKKFSAYIKFKIPRNLNMKLTPSSFLLIPYEDLNVLFFSTLYDPAHSVAGLFETFSI